MDQKAPLEALHPDPEAAALLNSPRAHRPQASSAPAPATALDLPGERVTLHLPLPAEARLSVDPSSPPGSPRSPRSPRALAAARRPPDPAFALSPLALPSLPERVLGTELRADPTEKAGHPGVPCSALPPGHAHRRAGRAALEAAIGGRWGGHLSGCLLLTWGSASSAAPPIPPHPFRLPDYKLMPEEGTM